MLIGIDIGTSGTKTVLFDDFGKKITSCTVEYPLYQPQNGWAEQDPEDWWHACYQSIAFVLRNSGISGADVKAIGLSGQMHGLCMLDKDGNSLRKSIIWCDGRTSEECEEITSIVGYDRLIDITCNPALTGFTASKIKWVMKHEPQIYEKCNKILLPKDYIRYRLTGEFATDVSDASGMQLLDVKNRCWSGEILSLLGIDKKLVADVYESPEITGYVSEIAAGLTGLKTGTPVVAGAGDQAASGIGNGIVSPGDVSATIGTSGVVFAYTDSPILDKKGRVHTFCHAVPGKWHVMGVTQAAGLSLKWFRDTFCNDEIREAESQNIDSYILLDRLAEISGLGAHGLYYLPYLMGERTPHLDPFARGVFMGLSSIHNKGDFTRAIIEGVTYSLRDCLEIIREMGIDVNSVIASGGGSKSELWRHNLADNFNAEVKTIASSEGGALGVAILAGTGIGLYSSVQEACSNIISYNSSFAPDLSNSLLYDSRYSVYKEIYQQLKMTFRKI